MGRSLSIALVGALLLASMASAASFAVYPTGVDNSYTPLAGGAADPHYTQHPVGGSQPYPQATVLSDANYWWQWPRSTTGKWIAPGDAFDTGARGWYKFRTTFDLTGLDPSTARIDGLWTCDQYGYIQVNRVDTGNTLVDGDYTSLHQFSVTNGFVDGVNLLDFLVYFPDGGAGVLCPLVIGTAADAGPARLLINEIQSANSSTVADEDGDHPDWIEIFNAGGQSINLQGYGLSDDPAVPFKWTFPSYTLGANRYLLVFASDKDRKTGPYFHTNYAIKSGGETVTLTSPGGQIADQVPAVTIPQDMSHGRKPDGQTTFLLFPTPTPGRPNFTTGYAGTLAAPTFSRARGFYNSAFNLTLGTSVSGAVIRYTTDGSEPTETSPAYSSAIPIPSGASGSVFRTTVVRARVLKDGYLPSPVATSTYFVGPNGTAWYNLPIVSLATTRANFFDPEIGIYVAGNHNNFAQEGDAWERPIHVEFFEPTGQCGFQCDAGVRIHGGYSVNYAQKGLRLYADHQGGPGSFNYQIWPESPLTDYKRIILRNAGNDNPCDIGYLGARYSLIRDGVAQSLIHDLDLDTQRYRPAIVFFNGEYWGIFGVVERQDKYCLENHHPEIDPDNLDLIQQHPNYYEIDEGDAAAFQAIMAYFNSNDTAFQANYDYVKSKMDVSNILTHNLARIYFGDTDWPGNNIRYWRERTAESKWRWAICDVDFSFNLQTPPSQNTLSFATSRGGTTFNPDWICVVIASLLRNREAHDEFINRMADMLNTVFVPSVVNAKIDSFASAIAPRIGEHFIRWNAGEVSMWAVHIAQMKDFANTRPDYVRNHFVRFFRLSGTSSLTLNASPQGTGSIAVSTVSLPGSSLPWSGIYFNDIPIKLTASPASGYRFVRWNGPGLGTQNPAGIVLSGNASVTAVFEPIQ